MSIGLEKKYMNDTLSKVKYARDRFTIYCGDGKILIGSTSSKDSVSPFSKIMNYKTIYDTIVDLDAKIQYSFKMAIEYAYSDSEFKLLSAPESMEEILTFYYIENAVFRTSSCWDMLAQLYRLHYDIDIEPDKVYYKRVFNEKNPQYVSFKDKAQKISAYINEEDDTRTDGIWKGNHKYINDFRNQMTHRNSTNITIFSDFDINIKNPPCFLLKRAIEDYFMSYKFIDEILAMIEVECKNELNEFFSDHTTQANS